jgi:hypothetical protein
MEWYHSFYCRRTVLRLCKGERDCEVKGVERRGRADQQLPNLLKLVSGEMSGMVPVREFS